MTIQVIRAGDLAATPWKNGGGVTRQIAVFPEGAGLAEFGWRVSLATVEAAGPFSTFSGVDRLMLVLEGRLELDMAGAGRLTLDPGSPAAEFPGDAPVSALAPAEPVTDINVMVRRGRYTARLERRRLTGAAAVVAQDVTLILAADEDLSATIGAEAHHLAFGDVVRLDGARGALVRLRSAGPAEMVVAHLNTVR